MEEKIIKVTTENGQEIEAEVLDIFNVEGYNNDYCLYTFGEEVDNDNERVYVSIIKETEDGYNFEAITDENEWNAVREALNESMESGEE